MITISRINISLPTKVMKETTNSMKQFILSGLLHVILNLTSAKNVSEKMVLLPMMEVGGGKTAHGPRKTRGISTVLSQISSQWQCQDLSTT